MLRSQGWEPGQHLGAENAVHSEYYGAASSSHIRAVLKDDNLGLGAKRNQGDECTGLDAFQDLLSRLNGKSDEVREAEKKVRSDMKMNSYLHRKLGTMRFVKGGWLVGDQVQELLDSTKKLSVDEDDTEDSTEASDSSTDFPKKEKKSKKRKADGDAEAEDQKDEKKPKKRKTAEVGEDDSKAARKEARRKRRKEKEMKHKTKAEPEAQDDEETGASERRKARKEKKEKKEKRKNPSKDGGSANTSDSHAKRKEKKKRKEESSKDTESASSSLPTPLPTPTDSGSSTPVMAASGRNLARKRFIEQKRLAFADPVALAQVRLTETLFPLLSTDV